MPIGQRTILVVAGLTVAALSGPASADDQDIRHDCKPLIVLGEEGIEDLKTKVIENRGYLFVFRHSNKASHGALKEALTGDGYLEAEAAATHMAEVLKTSTRTFEMEYLSNGKLLPRVMETRQAMTKGITYEKMRDFKRKLLNNWILKNIDQPGSGFLLNRNEFLFVNSTVIDHFTNCHEEGENCQFACLEGLVFKPEASPNIVDPSICYRFFPSEWAGLGDDKLPIWMRFPKYGTANGCVGNAREERNKARDSKN